MNKRIFLILLFTIYLIFICPITALSNVYPNDSKITFLLDKGEISSVVISINVTDAKKPIIIPVPFHLKDAKDSLNSSLVSIYNGNAYGLVLVFPTKVEKNMEILCDYKNNGLAKGVHFSQNTVGKTLFVPSLDENLLHKISSSFSYSNVIDYGEQIYFKILDDYIADTEDKGEISHSPQALPMAHSGKDYTIKIVPPKTDSSNSDIINLLIIFLSALPTLILSVATGAKNMGRYLAAKACIFISSVFFIIEVILLYNKVLKPSYFIVSFILLTFTWIIYILMNNGDKIWDKLEETVHSNHVSKQHKKYRKSLSHINSNHDVKEFILDNNASKLTILVFNGLEKKLNNLTQQERNEIQNAIENILSGANSNSTNNISMLSDNPEITIMNVFPFFNIVYTSQFPIEGSKKFILLDIENKI
ncbi:hypothetical protein [Clostridium ganghwense]|uniref:CHASE2 domain-containing protein n=1 Tax=Clostridium ganghwense TaxID=312089 RepID=A0ABT4CTL1_9CLOT|nr:hypothetical protein [Clostridium ganghwense]MCY6372402.1 hypothetical protein [Clostridium ganghwense]